MHTLPDSKTRRTALRHLLAGVTCARDSLMPRLQAYARDEVAGRHVRAGSESIGDPPSKIGEPPSGCVRETVARRRLSLSLCTLRVCRIAPLIE